MEDFVERLARSLSGLPPAELHGRLRELVAPMSLQERFRLLHRLGVYHHSESVSGAGSTLQETAAFRQALPKLVEEMRVASVLDIPCGDFRWMQHVAPSYDYMGADVVPEIVRMNQELHGSAGRRFVVLDATRDPLPKVDLIVCRDLLIHLSLRDCRLALGNFVASGSRLLLTSHFGDRTDNPEILSGDFRPVNLCRPPFSLPPPVQVIDERSELGEGAFRDRAMGLWKLSDVARALSEGDGTA